MECWSKRLEESRIRLRQFKRGLFLQYRGC